MRGLFVRSSINRFHCSSLQNVKSPLQFFPATAIERFNKMNSTLILQTHFPGMPFQKDISSNIHSLTHTFNTLSQEYYAEMRFIGETVYEHLIKEQPNQFIKALFSTAPRGEGSCPTLYSSPYAIKAAFRTLANYSPQVMCKIIIDGVNRIGVALSSLDTDQDIFKKIEGADATPLHSFMMKQFSSPAMPKQSHKLTPAQ